MKGTGDFIDVEVSEFYEVTQGEGTLLVPKNIDGLEVLTIISELDTAAKAQADELVQAQADTSRFDKTFEERQKEIAEMARLAGYREGLAAVLGHVASS